MIVFCLLLLVVLHVITEIYKSNHSLKKIIKSLFKHFIDKRDQIIELRIARDKTYKLDREVEVKTIHRKYYVVHMKGNKLLGCRSIPEFSISKDSSYIIGEVDPVDLETFYFKITPMELK